MVDARPRPSHEYNYEIRPILNRNIDQNSLTGIRVRCEFLFEQENLVLYYLSIKALKITAAIPNIILIENFREKSSTKFSQNLYIYIV